MFFLTACCRRSWSSLAVGLTLHEIDVSLVGVVTSWEKSIVIDEGAPECHGRENTDAFGGRSVRVIRRRQWRSPREL